MKDKRWFQDDTLTNSLTLLLLLFTNLVTYLLNYLLMERMKRQKRTTVTCLQINRRRNWRRRLTLWKRHLRNTLQPGRHHSTNYTWLVTARHARLDTSNVSSCVKTWCDMTSQVEFGLLHHYQWWANHKSNHKYKSQIICKKWFKSKPQIKNQITNNQIKSESFLVKIKSQINFTEMSNFWKCSVYIITIESRKKSQPFCIRQ